MGEHYLLATCFPLLISLMNFAGLAHSLSRYKLKFSPDKVDTMIVQAISLLDDIDKELNNYNMRCREWYGWHFPELSKIITDHSAYAKVCDDHQSPYPFLFPILLTLSTQY